VPIGLFDAIRGGGQTSSGQTSKIGWRGLWHRACHSWCRSGFAEDRRMVPGRTQTDITSPPSPVLSPNDPKFRFLQREAVAIRPQLAESRTVLLYTFRAVP